MNKLTIATMALAGAAAWAQLPYDQSYADKAETSVQAPAAPERLDRNVKKFVERQKANKLTRKVTLKSDVLGRRGGKAVKDSVQYKVNVSDTEKMKVVVSDVKVNDVKLETVSGRYEYDPSTEQKHFWLNGEKVSEQAYLNKAEKRKKKYDREKKAFKSPRIEYLTASEIEKKLSGNENVYISEYVEPKPQLEYGIDRGMDYTQLLEKSEIKAYAHDRGFKGQGVGVYYNEGGCPPLNYVNTSYYVQLETPCTDNLETHVIGVLRTLQKTAPQAMIYGIDGVVYPDNVDSYSQPILIGTQSWSFVPLASSYGSGDADMDNYIYENRVVEFVAAANDGRNSVIGSPSKALNAVTVGAVSPINDMYMSYSSSKNSTLGNDKPEVANYTNIRFPGDPSFTANGSTYNGSFGGTSAATPYTAGFTANLLSQHQFLWWHPEVVKATLITGSTRSVGNNDYDYDGRWYFEAGIPVYSKVSPEEAYRWRFWSGENNSNFDSNSEITFVEYNIKKNKRYRIAIAWLTSGQYILQNQKIAQDIDLSVHQNNKQVASSTSAKNPFELVDFVTTSDEPLTIKIKRYANRSASEKVILGYSFVVVD